MNIPDNFSESSETVFKAKILELFDADPGSGIFLILDQESRIEKFGSGIEKFGSRIRDNHPGSATLACNSITEVHIIDFCYHTNKTYNFFL